MNYLNSDRMFIKWETQLEILKQLLTKSKNDAFRRDGIKKVISLKDKFQNLSQILKNLENILLEEFDTSFQKLVQFVLEPSNLEKPNKLISYFITDALQIKQDQFLNQFQTIIEFCENMQVQDFTQSYFLTNSDEIVDATTPELFVMFHFTVIKQKQEIISFASNLIFKQVGSKFIHQTSRKWLSRKIPNFSFDMLQDVILAMIIQCDEKDNKRTLFVNLKDNNVTFADEKHQLIFNNSNSQQVNKELNVQNQSDQIEFSSIQYLTNQKQEFSTEMILHDSKQVFGIDINDNIRITYNPLTNWQTKEINF